MGHCWVLLGLSQKVRGRGGGGAETWWDLHWTEDDDIAEVSVGRHPDNNDNNDDNNNNDNDNDNNNNNNNNNNNGPNGHLFYVDGNLMMRKGMLPIVMLPNGDLRIMLHLLPF